MSGAALHDVVKTFGDVLALDHVTLDLPAGALVALMGEPHAGKTTLLHVLAGLKSPDSGRVVVDDVAVHELDHEGRRRFLHERVAALVTGEAPSRPGRSLPSSVALVLADDPTYALPRSAAALVVDHLAELRAPGRVVVVATHSTTVAASADLVVDVIEGRACPR